MKMLISYFVALVLFVVIDLVWLGYVARSTYAAELGSLVRTQVDYRAAFAFYLLYAAGLLYFAVLPSASSGQALILGAGLGLVAYGTYDLTNLAVINGFGVKIALIDLAWGTVLSGVSAMLAQMITNRFN
jgi:uncharacterized membrane protein